LELITIWFLIIFCYFYANSLKSKIQFTGRHESEGKGSGKRLETNGSLHCTRALDVIDLAPRHIAA